MDDNGLHEADLEQPDDGFIPHTGEKRPEGLPHTQGAIVLLRSGELALFPPAATTAIIEAIHYWDKMFEYDDDDDDDEEGQPSVMDIVAYKPLPVGPGDELARAALHALQFVGRSLPKDDWASGHSIGESMQSFGATQACKRVKDAVRAYGRGWPGDPALVSLRRLGRWFGDVDCDTDGGEAAY